MDVTTVFPLTINDAFERFRVQPQSTPNRPFSPIHWRVLAFAFAVTLASGCVSVAKNQTSSLGADSSAEDDDGARTGSARRVEPLPKQELTGKILYQIMVAEIAAQRGDVRLAAGAYLDLAKSTRDPRIARRAAELAHFARQNEPALEAVRVWIAADPGSAPAQYMLLGLLAQAGQFDEVQAVAVKILDIERDDRGGALLRIGRLAMRSAEPARVRETIDRVTEPHLKLPEARMLRAQVASLSGDMSRAEAETDAALSLRPGWEQALLFKVQIQQRNDPEKALETMRRHLAKHPQARDLRLQFARSLVGAKRYTEARSEFQRLLVDFPDNKDVIFAVGALSYQLKDYALAQRSFGKLTGGDFAEADAARLYLGQIAETEKRFEDAIGWYRSVPQGDQYITAQVRQAQVLAQQDKVEDARKHLRSVAAANPRDRVQLTLAEGQILRDGGRPGEALGVLEKGLAAEPNHPDLLYDAALVAEKLGRMDVLETHLRRLIQLKPDHAHAYNALGYSLAERNERLAEAETLVAKALQLAPDDAFIMDSMGWVLYRKGDLKGAVDYLERAYRMRPDPEIAAHLGEVQWMIGQRDAATRTWREAEKANPDNEVLSAVIKRFLH